MKYITIAMVVVIVLISIIDIYKYLDAKKSFGQVNHRINTLGVLIDLWAGMIWFFVASVVLLGEGPHDYHYVLLNFSIGLGFLIRAKMKYIEINFNSLFFSKQVVHWKQVKSAEIKKIYLGYLIIVMCNIDYQKIIRIRCFSKSKSSFEEYLKLNKIQFTETADR